MAYDQDLSVDHIADNRENFKSCKNAAALELKIDADHPGIHISQDLYGIFFEDINHAADGGLYAELIQNRSFEDDAATPKHWSLVKTGTAEGSIALDGTTLLNSAQSKSLRVDVTTADPQGSVGISNDGYWGISVKSGIQYDVSFFSKASSGFTGDIKASIQSADGKTVYGQAILSSIGMDWKKYTATITSNGTDSNARFVLSITTVGSVWFDVVSLFPPTFCNRPNGLRQDLATMIKEMKPRFMRFPGGCFVEGSAMANAFRWKTTIGKIEERSGHQNLWGYRTTDGMGYHEFLQFCEDLGAEPLYVINVGIAHKDNISLNQLDSWIEDVLDAIEYANGDITTQYGAMRAANGHPASFAMKYIEIGNENNQHDNVDNRSNLYGERYMKFYNAIKSKYPNIQTIGNVEAWGTDTPSWQYSYPVEMVDEHYYRGTQWFIDMANKYDSYSRKGPKIYVGEYAVTSAIDCGKGNLNAAIGEAAYMTGLERNSDIVKMASYAPLLVNANNRAWNPDAIVYNASSAYGTPSYYVQKMFASNLGDVILPTTLRNLNHTVPSSVVNEIVGQVGIGSWNTVVSYGNVSVTRNSDNSILLADDFSKIAPKWTVKNGTWSLSYNQTDTTATPGIMVAGSSDWNNYTLLLTAKKTSGSEGMMIYFGYMDGDNFYDLNLGGWNNTLHAIQKNNKGNSSILVSKPGAITAGQTYKIKIVVSGANIKAYLDDQLLLDVTDPSPVKPVHRDPLYYVASKDAIGDIIIKVVNPNHEDRKTAIKINGIAKTLSGTASVLTSDSIADENSFTNPAKVAPVDSRIAGLGASKKIHYTFSKNSITVLRLKIHAHHEKLLNEG
jgi:alpha-L-arabinofuranosidase